MKLIILYTKVIITRIGTRSHNTRVQGLSHMKRKADIIIRRIRHPGMKPKFWLNELFHPIKENANRNHIKPVFPIQRAFKKCRQAYTQNRQGKEMPPDKLHCLLGFVPNILNSIHTLSPLHPFILPSLPSRKRIKNNIFLNRSQELCP